MPRRTLSAVTLLSSILLVSACGTPTEAADRADPTPTATQTRDAQLHDQLPDAVKSSGTLKLGALWETPPMIGVNASDTSTPVGLAPDLAAALGQVLGVQVTWQNVQWPAQLPGVQSGAVDALMGQVTDTAEREQSVVDLVPFYKSTESLLLPKDDTKGITSLATACGRTIGVPVGSTQGQEVSAASDAHCAGNAIRVAEYQGATAAISAVRAGTIDGWLDTTTSQLQAVKASSGAFTTAELPADESPVKFTAIAVGKANPGLSNALVGALKELIDNGTYADVLAAQDVSSAAVTADEVVVNPLTGTAAGATAK